MESVFPPAAQGEVEQVNDLDGRRGIRSGILILGLLLCYPLFAEAGDPVTETKERAVIEGDRLSIRNNEGLVLVRTWKEDSVRVHITKKPASGEPDDIDVLFWKIRNQIYLHSYLYANAGETVDLEISVPSYLHVTVRGIGPEVRLAGLGGIVRVETLRGSIEARDLSSRVRLFNRTGNIDYRTNVQPRARATIGTNVGNVLCEIAEGLNVRLSAQAGGQIFWNGRIVEDRIFRKSLGGRKPLIAVESTLGDVRFRYGGSVAPTPDLLNPVPTPADRGADPPVVSHLGPGRRDRGTTFKVAVDWVHLNVSVHDRLKNQNVTDLSRDDFAVLEDDVPQVIEKFETTESPFHLFLLLDVSGSVESYIKLLKKATLGFTRELRRDDRIAVAVFNDRPRLVQDFTNDRKKVEKAIKRLDSGGGTGFYNAVDSSLKEFLRQVEGRKAMVVFTDGVDNALLGNYRTRSDITFRDLYRNVQESDSLVYTIFLNTKEDLKDYLSQVGMRVLPERVFKEARLQLQLIAEQTGGRLYTPENVKDLAPVYKEIAGELRHKYTLGFKSNGDPDRVGWRTLKVEIRGRPDSVPRHRRGYFISTPKN